MGTGLFGSSPAPSKGPVGPEGVALWVAGARVKTLPAAVVPVAVGTAAAFHEGQAISWWRAVLAMVVALALQIATNFANDYSDGVRGTDDERRVGPLRLVGSGLAEAGSVKRAAVIAFSVAGVAGAVLAIAIGPELFVVGAVSILAGWGYTGGPKPYGYLGLGEVFVFVFFGLVATMGSTYVQLERLTAVSLVAGIGVGALATALLVINNLRDRLGDEDAGKRTLAVRMGDVATRRFYVVLVAVAAVAAIGLALQGRAAAAMGIAATAVAIAPIKTILDGAAGSQLLPTLGQTGKVQMAYGLLLAIGLVLT